jgi:Tol biopolymer transport system component
VFSCGADVRAISNVATATVSTDFSLLPSGFLSNAFTDTNDVSWSPNSQWIALRADRDVNSQFDLYLTRWSAPGVAYKPHANSLASGVTTCTFAPNSQSIAFVGTIASQSNAALYLSKLPTSGAPPTATLVSAPASSVVQPDITWLPGSRLVAYRATVSGSAQLFAVPVAADGSAGSVIPISGVSGSGVSSYQLAPGR